MKRAAQVAGLVLALTACHKQPRLATLPAPAPKQVDTKIQPLPEPPQPDTSIAPGSTGPTVPAQVGPLPPPPPPARRTRRSKPAPNVPAVAPAPPVTAPEPPRLGQMISPNEQRRYNDSIDKDLRTARAGLAKLGSRQLNESQTLIRKQVESFVGQAEEMRKTDLLAAKGFAEKAAILAKEFSRF